MAAATPTSANDAYEAMLAAANARPLGNGSMFLMPSFDRMPGAGKPGGTFAYGNLADQFIDANRMIDAGPGQFFGNTAGRYKFGGGTFGSGNPNAAAGQGLLGFGGGSPLGQQGPQYNPFAGRGNSPLPFGPPGGGAPGGAPGGGIPPSGGAFPGVGGVRNPGGGGLLGGPSAPGAAPPSGGQNIMNPANWQGTGSTNPTIENLARIADPKQTAQLLGLLGGDETALHQMYNYYGVGGQGYDPSKTGAATHQQIMGNGGYSIAGLNGAAQGDIPLSIVQAYVAAGKGQIVNGKYVPN